MLNLLILFNPRLHPLPGEGIEGGEDEALGAVFAVFLHFVVLECGECDGGAIRGIFGRGIQDVGQLIAGEPVKLGIVSIQLRLELSAAVFIPRERFPCVP